MKLRIKVIKAELCNEWTKRSSLFYLLCGSKKDSSTKLKKKLQSALSLQMKLSTQSPRTIDMKKLFKLLFKKKKKTYIAQQNQITTVVLQKFEFNQKFRDKSNVRF